MENVWSCITGDAFTADIPAGAHEGMEGIVFGSYLQLLGIVPDHIQSGWVPVGLGYSAWAVMVGSAKEDLLPYGADLPMRHAAALAWKTAGLGPSYQFMSSGWAPLGSEWVTERAKEWFGATSVFLTSW